MTSRFHRHRLALAAAALALLGVLALPASRQLLESGMTRHMLVQFPLLAGCGFLLAGAMSAGRQARIASWNAHGITGLLAVALVLGVLMIPRVLDLALLDARVESLKWLALVLAGAALRLSWRPAGLLMQGFFLGNVLPMTVVAGHLYQDSPVRLCNAYLLGDQVWLGQLLVWISAAIAAGWFARLVASLVDKDRTPQERAQPFLSSPDNSTTRPLREATARSNSRATEAAGTGL